MLASSPVTAPVAMKSIVDGVMGDGMESGAMLPRLQNVPCDSSHITPWDVSDHIQFQYRREAEIGCQTIHPSISQKRSWSTAFKAHCHAEREREYRELERQLRDNKAMVEKLAIALGIWRGA